MGKKQWLLILCICMMLSGCGSQSTDSAVMETEAAVAVYEAAPEIAAEEGDGTATTAASAKEDTGSRMQMYIYEGSTEDVQSDSLTYFTFNENSFTHCDDEGEPILLEVLTQTAFYSQCDIQTKWVNDILTDLQVSDAKYSSNLLEYARKNQKEEGDSFYCHSHYVSRGVARHDESVISLLSLASVYSGGMHPYNIQTAYNLDMKQLRTLTLEEVIEPEGCGRLLELLISKVEEKFALLEQSGLVENYRKILSDAVSYGKMTPYWYFNDNGLVVFFNQYELAENAAGIVKIELEYDTLDGVLKESYFPERIEGWATNIAVDRKANQGTVYDVNLGEGETVYIIVSGKATQVQLSEVSFVEQTPVDATMLFSANRLNEDITLALTISVDPEITYAVEYYDSGGQKILYFKDNQLMTSIQ